MVSNIIILYMEGKVAILGCAKDCARYLPSSLKNAKKIAIRPENIAVNQNMESLLEGTIKVRTYLGENYQYEVDTELGEIVVNTSIRVACRALSALKTGNFMVDSFLIPP